MLLAGCGLLRFARWQGYRDQPGQDFPRHSLQVVGAGGIDPGRHFLRDVNNLDLH
jgi:hypothetical protein